MKKTVCLLLGFLLLSGCAAQPTPPLSPSDALSPTDAGETGTRDLAITPLPDTDLRDRTAETDLTVLDTQMAYVQLSNMMLSPEDYEGKTVKLQGRFAHAAEQDREFFVCYLLDATACCSQSLEFETDGTYDFPEAYPPEQSEITVFGTFNVYEYNGFRMYRLRHAEVDYTL